jgi:hypothetical protein
MPACKNDASRKYKGDEPSPKGLGWCAHAETAGATRKGKDGRKWTVALDKNGTKSWKVSTAKATKPAKGAEKSKTKLMVPPLVKGAAPMTLTKSMTFSDGKSLSWGIGSQGHQPQLYDHESNDFSPMTRAHWDAVMSPRDIVLRLDRGDPLPDIDVKVSGPATIGKVLLAMHKFYSTKLSASDYQVLETQLWRWSPDDDGTPTTLASLKKRVRTYGDSKGDHTALSGFNGGLMARFNPFSNVYRPYWDS